MKPSALVGPVPVARAPVDGPAPALGGRTHLAAAASRLVGSVAVMVLADMRPDARAWAWMRLVLGPRALRGTPGLGFAKVLGSGAGGGFGLQPSGTHRGLYLVFDGAASARAFIDTSPVLAAWRAHARECSVSLLRAFASKGSWDGSAMAVSATAPLQGPIAALTRASIRLPHALPFWRLSPAAEIALQAACGCRLAVGLGEAPLLRQCTFSLWDSVAAMDRYARGGAHQQAIRSAQGGGYFSESMFVRYAPIEIRGVWQGRQHG